MRGDSAEHSPLLGMKSAFCAALALAGLTAQGAQARDRDPAEEAQRWQDVREPVFHGRPIQDAGEEVKLIAPGRAMDAALVPLTVELHAKKRVTAVTVFIDNNPAPVVGTFHFGPAISPDQIKFRVRINDYTLVHAVAETEDGTLLATEYYVKAAGGCSAPASGQTAETAARLGQMQLHRTRPLEGTGVPSQLLISHPNYNGMQSTPSGGYIPARYLDTVTVKAGGVTVFELQSDISLSEDPVINFTYTPSGDGGVDVVAHDSSGAEFKRHFDPLS
jgi:sulfur-oxidizing protein SoxY